MILNPGRKELDLTNINKVKERFETNHPTIVILAAAKVGGFLQILTPLKTFLIENLKIQTNVIETASENNVKRLLFLGVAVFILKNQDNQLRKNIY